MAIHILGGGVGDDVGAPLKRPAVDGRSKGIIDDEGHTMGMGDMREALDVEHLASGIGDGLTKDELGVRTEGCLELSIGSIGTNEGA